MIFKDVFVENKRNLVVCQKTPSISVVSVRVFSFIFSFYSVLLKKFSVSIQLVF